MTAHSKLILLLEPDEAVRSALSAMLRQCGWQVEAREDGAGLEGLLTGHAPAAVVCESSLPDIKARKVLETAGKHNIPVVFLSHAREVQDAVDLMRWGARDFLEKPFPQKRLLKSLESLAG